MKLAASLLFGLSLSLGAFAQAEPMMSAWQGFSDPDIISSGFNHVFSELPLSGSIPGNSTKGWSGDYWASKRGGINRRWNHPLEQGFNYASPSKQTVLSMSQEQLAQLSPTEKYDIFTGNYHYPLKAEASGTASRFAKDWAGICHGWAPASLHHNEPTPKSLKNSDGIIVPFGSADIKALVSYYYAFHYEVESTDQIGLRCYFGSWLGGMRACNEDLNAGALHIILANKLGVDHEGMMMDKDRYNEVWNQPITGFKSTIIGSGLRRSSGAAYGTVSEVRVSTELYYTDESDPTWATVQGTANQKNAVMVLQYRLELNAEGKIIGGTWESASRPDFLWNKPKAPAFEGILSRLPELLND